MTDLDCVQQAVKAVLKKARTEGSILVPITGYTIMEWFQEALRDEQDKREAVKAPK
jgi:hypothetical protein